MLVSEGSARNDRHDTRLAITLAGVAGALNAAAFHAVGFFSANMTGNLTSLSDHIATAGLGLAAFFLTIVLAFVAGAAISTLLINAGRRRKAGAVYAYSILLEGVLLTAVGLLDMQLSGNLRVAVLVIGLSFLMGLQNAVGTLISNAKVRTTHASGMLTDIGIGLAVLFDMRRHVEPDNSRPEVLSRLRLHLQTVIAFVAGGLAGVLAYQKLGGTTLVATAVLLLLVALPPAVRSRRTMP